MNFIPENLDAVLAMMRGLTGKTKADVDKHLKQLAQYTEREVKVPMTKQHGVDTGDSRRSIHTEYKSLWLEKTTMAIIRPSVPTVNLLENDTRPHWPPPGALQDWARRHHMPEFIIARHIAMYGTKGLHMFKRAYGLAMRKSRDMTAELGYAIGVHFKA